MPKLFHKPKKYLRKKWIHWKNNNRHNNAQEWFQKLMIKPIKAEDFNSNRMVIGNTYFDDNTQRFFTPIFYDSNARPKKLEIVLTGKISNPIKQNTHSTNQYTIPSFDIEIPSKMIEEFKLFDKHITERFLKTDEMNKCYEKLKYNKIAF